MNRFLKKQKLFSVLAIIVIGLMMHVQVAHAAAGSCGAWTVVTSPGPGQDNLYSVVAVSARNVWAVGGYQTGGIENTLIEHWNGTNWSVVSSPNAGSYISVLESVAAITAKDIWAVGFSSASSSSLLQTLIEQWDGTSWTIV